MQTKILNIIPENLRGHLIKEVVALIKDDPSLLEDNEKPKTVDEDIKTWAKKNQQKTKIYE